MERIPERLSLPRGVASFGSRRGMSSHHSNPFVILCDRHATENTGDCYGCMLMYSGNHLEERYPAFIQMAFPGRWPLAKRSKRRKLFCLTAQTA